MDSAEIVIDGMNRDHRGMVLNLLGKAIRQTGKTPHPDSHCQVVPLYIAGADMARIGIATNKASL